MLSWDWQPNPNTPHLDYSRPAKAKTDDMREYNRVYREKHSGYIDCGCGARFKEISKYTHVKTARHVKWLGDKSSV